MEMQLIQGQFKAADAIEIVTQLIHVKVKYHENKINSSSSEEEIKFRESKIKRLQEELVEFRNYTGRKNGPVKLESIIQVEI